MGGTVRSAWGTVTSAWGQEPVLVGEHSFRIVWVGPVDDFDSSDYDEFVYGTVDGAYPDSCECCNSGFAWVTGAVVFVCVPA